MANSQPLGAGDGPANLSMSCLNPDPEPSLPWTNLPLSVCNVLGSKMDMKDLCDMRLVCTEWQKSVEKCIGLKVKIDDSDERNLDFVRRVKVGSARILNWTEDIGAVPANLLFQYPDWLKKLKLCGKMPAQWKIHNLRQFSSLAHLILRDKALHSNNLTGHQYPVINFDPTSELSPEDTMAQAYRTQDPPSEAQNIELKSLQTLEIIRYDYYTNMTTTKLPTHSYLLMMTNLCFILSHVTSPLLSVVHLAISQPGEIRSYNKLNWTLVPLHRLLNNHRKSLRQLILPSLHTRSSELSEDENLSNSFPINLWKLMLELEGPWRDLYSQEPSDQSTFTYLHKCLQGQTQIQEVQFTFNSFPVKWTSDAFTWLANSCGRTLRYLELQGYPSDNTTSLDLQILSVCQSLEVLHLPWCGRSILNFRNVEKLPASLKRLVIGDGDEGCKVELGDPNIFKRLTCLEWICLHNVSLLVTSNDGNQEPERQFCRTMIKGLVSLRQLQGFYLHAGGVALNTDPSIVAILRSLGQDMDPASRFPYNRAYLNMRWQDSTPAEPWSDKPFDKNTWDLEKYRDDIEEPRHATTLGRIIQEMDENDPEENVDDEEEHVDDDMQNVSSDDDVENMSSDEDDV